MEFVPSYPLKVVRWSPTDEEQRDKPSTIAWIVKNKDDADKPFRYWIRPEHIETLHGLFPDESEISTAAARNSGFVRGRALIDTGITIKTIGTEQKRPRVLWRVVHRGQPFGGTKPRSHEGTTSMSFQIRMQRHFNWKCRQPSPFMSVTSDKGKATRVAALYEAMGFRDIRVIKIQSIGPEWDYQKQRLWSAKDLIQQFELKRIGHKPYWDFEYLVEDSLPTQCLTSYEWNDVKGVMDRSGSIRSKALHNRMELKRGSLRKKDKEVAAALTKVQGSGDGMDGEAEGNVNEGKLREVRKRSRGFMRMLGSMSAEA